jgi:DNA-binding XRE family transcriptional regulator
MITHYRWVAQLWVKGQRYWVARHRNRKQPTTSPQDAFGAVLRQLRLKSELSQDAYAHQTGYHRNYIGQLERGEKSPSLNALFAFARSFGMQPSELLRRVETLV